METDRTTTEGHAIPARAHRIAFVCNGQGPQWWGMGRQLLETEPVFAEAIAACEQAMRPHVSWRLVEELTRDEATSRMQETPILQPGMFAIQIALARLWESWGVAPDGVIGHSMGEVGAACIAGVISLSDAVTITCQRSRIQHTARADGGMMFVERGPEDFAQLAAKYSDRIWLSAENSPRAITVSGERAALAALADDLERDGVFCRLLEVNCACHGPHMDDLRPALEAALGHFEGRDGRIPIYSTLQGRAMPGRAFGAHHWWENFRAPVLFAPAIRAMLEDGFDTFIELSPHPVLRASILEIAGAANRDDVLVVASLRRTADDRKTMLQALGELRAGGRPGDFQRLRSGSAETLDLPGIRPGGSTTARTSYALRGDLAAGLDRLLTDVLGAPLERSTPLVELGLDSLMAMQVLNVLRRDLSLSLRMPDLLRDHMTAGALEAHVREQLARAPSPAPASAPARVATERLPLSRAQQRLWFLHALTGEGPAYNVHYAYRLRGDLDTRALAAAVQAIVDRHDSLRTTYHAEGGVPYQIVHGSADAELPCSPASPDELDARLEAFRRRPFDLSAHLMMRTELLRLADDDHVLLVNLHHIAVDGWSLGCLFRELDALYAAHRRGAPPPLPPLAASYTELALDETGSPDDLRYWQDQLRGAPPSTTLPPLRPRALDPSHEAGVVHLELSEPLTAALRRLARTHRATLNTALMAMFTALIARRTGANDLVIGTPVANRTSAESEALIGVFINFVAIRTQLDPRMTFQAVLDHTRATVNEALAHQAAPFEQVVTHLERQGSVHAHPVFQILFQTLSATIADLALDGLRCERLPFRRTGAKFDLTVILVEHATRVSGSIEYSLDRYVDEQIRTLAADLVACLEAAVADPAIALAGLPIASGPAPIVPAPPAIETGLYPLLEQQMGRTPAAPALNHAGRTLSYGRLAEASEALAARLRAHGLPPEFRAGVCLPRTPDLVVALLGILRAGGCYVPIDPQYPHERQAYMLEDSRAEVLVTDASGRDRFRGFTGLVLDASEASRAAPPPASAPAAAVHPDQLAYLIYTSGSTGRPKGAGITHRNAVSFLRWAARAFPTITGEAVLASTSICFDLSIFELFFPLAFGGRVVLVDNLLEAHETLAAEAVTLINTVPSVMDGFLQRGPVPPSVATVNLAGEPLSRRLADALYAHATVERVVNLYGPTEDTTYSTWKRIARDDGDRPSIGAPIDGSFACIVDADLQLVPDGVAGELLLGGAGLCRGYERRPGLTAERFVPDPFSGTPGGRLYRTGDLCRRLPGGDLDYLQRNDHQVKIRGFRIELAEIDHCAAAVAGVGECVTVVQAADSAAARLVSFVVPEATCDPGLAGRILARLRQVLPAHSVPSRVVLLDRLPVTPNGKVDRKALAALTVEIVPGDPEARRPEKPDELALAEIWASVLRIGAEHVTLDADFFSLGGNSLLIIQLIARLRDRWGIDTTIRTMFERRTFASQVDLVGELQRASAPTKPPGTPAGRKVIRL